MTISQILGALLTLSLLFFVVYNVVDIVRKIKNKRKNKQEVSADEAENAETEEV